MRKEYERQGLFHRQRAGPIVRPRPLDRMWLFVLARWPATKAAYGPVLFPIVSVAMSAWLTGEVVTASFVLGAAVTLAGVWLGAISRSARAATPAPAPRPEMVDCGAHC